MEMKHVIFFFPYFRKLEYTYRNVSAEKNCILHRVVALHPKHRTNRPKMCRVLFVVRRCASRSDAKQPRGEEYIPSCFKVGLWSWSLG